MEEKMETTIHSFPANQGHAEFNHAVLHQRLPADVSRQRFLSKEDAVGIQKGCRGPNDYQ